MADERYVVYIGTYTKGKSRGIHILDLDMEHCSLTERTVISANSPSYVMVSHSGKYLYSTSDQGVSAYRITEGGDLQFINSQWNGGMRGCWLETDPDDRFLFVAGYYDGRISVMHLNEDGSVGTIADGIFHEGITEVEPGHDYTPHITCVTLTPDRTGIFAVDLGLDQITEYAFDAESGRLSPTGIIRCELDSNPRQIRADRTGRHLYVLCEQTNHVCVYDMPKGKITEKRGTIEPIQKISTLGADRREKAASFGIEFSPDGRHLFVSNTVTNTVMVYDVDGETGLLSVNCSGSISGEYPKSLAVLPDNEHFIVLGLHTGTVTTYRVNYEEQYFLMTAKPLLIDQPNSIYIHRL